LNHLWNGCKKKGGAASFLPFLLIALRPDVKMMTRHLWQSIDELVIKTESGIASADGNLLAPDLLATQAG